MISTFSSLNCSLNSRRGRSSFALPRHHLSIIIIHPRVHHRQALTLRHHLHSSRVQNRAQPGMKVMKWKTYKVFRNFIFLFCFLHVFSVACSPFYNFSSFFGRQLCFSVLSFTFGEEMHSGQARLSSSSCPCILSEAVWSGVVLENCFVLRV